MRTAIVVIATAALLGLHQDVWLWNDARLVLGVIPIGLAYHAAYTLAASLFLWALVRWAWPGDVLEEADGSGEADPCRAKTTGDENDRRGDR